MAHTRDFEWWRTECAYISRQVDAFQKDSYVAREFNGDRTVLLEYMELQRNTAENDGRFDSASYIQHCIDDLKVS